MQNLVVVLHLLLKRNMDLKSPMEREIIISIFQLLTCLTSRAIIKVMQQLRQTGNNLCTTKLIWLSFNVKRYQFPLMNAVDYSNGVLTITNSEGRNLAVEEFSSEYGHHDCVIVRRACWIRDTCKPRSTRFRIRLERGYGTATLSASSATLKVAVGGSSTTNATITDLDLQVCLIQVMQLDGHRPPLSKLFFKLVQQMALMLISGCL